MEDFIGTLSEKLIDESKANPGPFDANPFLQTFSPALDSLLSLRSQMAERTKRMESDVRRAEREYGKRLRELDGGFEVGSSNVNGLIKGYWELVLEFGEQDHGCGQVGGPDWRAARIIASDPLNGAIDFTPPVILPIARSPDIHYSRPEQPGSLRNTPRSVIRNAYFPRRPFSPRHHPSPSHGAS